jgi:hypothetical protein
MGLIEIFLIVVTKTINIGNILMENWSVSIKQEMAKTLKGLARENKIIYAYN